MPIWGSTLILQLAPIVFSMLAPIVTGLIEAIGEKLGVPIAKPALPVINGAAGAGLAVAASMNTPVSPLAIPLGLLGAQLGNRVREAVNKSKAEAKPA